MTAQEFIEQLPDEIPIQYKTRNEAVNKMRAWVYITKALVVHDLPMGDKTAEGLCTFGRR